MTPTKIKLKPKYMLCLESDGVPDLYEEWVDTDIGKLITKAARCLTKKGIDIRGLDYGGVFVVNFGLTFSIGGKAVSISQASYNGTEVLSITQIRKLIKKHPDYKVSGEDYTKKRLAALERQKAQTIKNFYSSMLYYANYEKGLKSGKRIKPNPGGFNFK